MIYLDNGATSFPKPANVINSSLSALKNYSFNSGRGGYKQSVAASEKIYNVREKIAAMFNFEPQNISFTKNCTEALNIAISGSVKPGDHIIISSLEHNAVWRVVSRLKKEGICDFDIAGYSCNREECADNFEKLITPKTSLIVCMSASNVFGVTFPIREIGMIAKKHGIRFVVDGAQSAGLIPIDSQKDEVDILCAPGHKCLFGSMGSGFIAVRDGISVEPVIVGGTGSNSLSSEQPDFYPDRLEAGTLNNSGIISIGAGIDFINKNGMGKIYEHELGKAQFLFDCLDSTNGAVLYCPRPCKRYFAPIISFNYKDFSSEKVAAYLAEHDIAVRGGYHCSPLAHSYFGTLDRGAVRLCPSIFTTQNECEIFINSLKKL
ncbi:MAG: aminotransferase class V-fold PLP-dependent enzyme [Clostridiales bacterium]|nr:aminotransferase class V-fold PLP-dependent enzyme [Clostridiales bacterium]